ncbi:hypothetical protein QUF61_03565 [Candidatus Venteria ishoeyi]|uniref:hypothetical protein n=1 Tax=Candidatus Venteria ishoeyi TaxID=1899563 RepID=UPI0025A5993B|nr:hypothetical protein [Candidatus Venteria ishoeyi]MDM8545552.1 hypothetical protein [Candidatus Venteria ishoeyi]
MSHSPQLAEQINGLPNICGEEQYLSTLIAEHRCKPVSLTNSPIAFERIKSACAIALHMHQPLIPAGGDELQTAEIIGNLQDMMAHQNIGDNHNAPVFQDCYQRMGRFIPELMAEGKQPRVMLEYSGTLLFALRQMGADAVIEHLQTITCDPQYQDAVEWLGCPWGHAVAPSTPVQDYRLHVRAWQHHFAAIFGAEALARVRGFSPSEMALPNHPDVAYEFVKTLNDAGYQWVLLQEHTIEDPATGNGIRNPHLPHRLVCTNSNGETAEIIAIIKTQGSDSKLVAQMQPWYEAQSLDRQTLAGHAVPPLVTQIADGENGGVMMNEFPPKYQDVVREASGSQVPLMNVSEYLDHLFALGIQMSDLPVVQPVLQKHIWERFDAGSGAEKLEQSIKKLKQEDDRFHMDGGSWTNNISWVAGYENVLGPMEQSSVLFSKKVLSQQPDTRSHAYRNALYHLMASQTSCYRYWGQGLWTDYGREICRRSSEIILHDF